MDFALFASAAGAFVLACGVIDLHSHTTESDGTLTPAELVELARSAKLQALAITDHDTFDALPIAAPIAKQAGLRLVAGIELNTRFGKKTNAASHSVHLLGYWPTRAPGEEFIAYLDDLRQSRRERNAKLVDRLRGLGVDISLPEVESIGKSITGRPHFARVLLRKGYVRTVQEAFDRYLGESAPGYVERESPTVEEAISRIHASGGVASVAHPIRLGFPTEESEEEEIAWLAEHGLRAIECYHSDHSPEDMQRYLAYAERYGLAPTGGSDFHGANKPDIELGLGRRGNLSLPMQLLEGLERVAG